MSSNMRRSQGPGNYEYVGARVRSRRRRLFDEDDYRKLVRMAPSEIARFMEESEYEEEMNALGSRRSGVDLIEHALYRNLASTFQDLLGWSSGSLYGYIARYLRRFDAWNIKTVLRGVYAEANREAIEIDLVRAGELPDRVLDDCLDLDSVEAVVDRLSGTVFGPALADAYPEYEERRTLVPLENAVDRVFYESLLSGLPVEASEATDQYVDFLRAEIDFRNVRNALRLARSNADMDPTEYYIEGGYLFGTEEIRSLVGNVDELVARLRSSRYGEELDEALDELDNSTSLIGFERALDAALLGYADHLSYSYPLSVCPIFAYVLAKEREVENIQAIARGQEAGLSAEEIEEELIIL